MAVDSNARIREFIDTVLNAGDIDATAGYFHEGVVEEVPFPGQGPGIEGLKSVLRQFRIAFPDMYWNVEEQIADGEKVLTRFTWTGTHKAEFLGMPATGRGVSVWGMVLDRFQGSKVKSTRILMDTLGMMQQLGVVPAGPGSHTVAA